MARNAYAPTSAPIRTSRGTEYEAFAQVTHRLQSAARGPGRRIKAIAQAVHENRQLWTLLATDVMDDANRLPAQLRGQILYLSEFTRLHSSRVLAAQASLDPLIDINTAVMRGLRGNPAGAA
jgi:flagellar protein FlaF